MNAALYSSDDLIQKSVIPPGLDIEHQQNVDTSVQQLMTYWVPGTPYQQTNQSIHAAGTMPWITTFMKPLQENSQGFAEGSQSQKSSSPLDCSIIGEESYINGSSFDFSQSGMPSHNNSFPDRFSKILADCLSYRSFGILQDIGNINSNKYPPMQSTNPVFYPANKSNENADYDTKVNQCHLCYKIFRAAKSLHSHRKRHFSLPGITCIECGKSFYQLSVLKKHMRIHTTEKPFQCDICYYQFNQKSNMNRHRKLHFRTSIK